jgi:hypothetical protein
METESQQISQQKDPEIVVRFREWCVPNAAGVAKLAYAADSKSGFCSFCPLRNSSQQSETTEESQVDALPPLAGLLATL